MRQLIYHSFPPPLNLLLTCFILIDHKFIFATRNMIFCIMYRMVLYNVSYTKEICIIHLIRNMYYILLGNTVCAISIRQSRIIFFFPIENF